MYQVKQDATFRKIVDKTPCYSYCRSDDRVTLAKPLSPGNKLVSDGGAFALGFFCPTNSTVTLYVGIWYHNIPECTVVWVANCDNPIAIPSSAILAVTNRSDLVLSDSKDRTLWTTMNNITTGVTGAAAVLLNTGNLVLRLPNGTDIWQSFDHPTDTVLPGMRLWLNYKAHTTEHIIAWKGPGDPSTGEFSLIGDSSSGLQLLILRGTSPYWRTRMWNGVTASGMYQSNISSVWYQTVVDNGDEIQLMYTTSDGSPNTRWTLDYTGMVKFLIWNNSSLSWTVFVELPSPDCRRYDSCGLFGYCDVTGAIQACKCLEGFEPGGHNFSRGCLRKQALKCGEGDHFLTVPGMTTPDKFLYVRNRSFDECAAECNHNCSCTTYAYTNWTSVSTIGDPSRCLVWMGELVHTGKAGNIGENLYLRLAGSPGIYRLK